MPIRHVIRQGDSVIQLSEAHGLFAETIWNDAANAELKALRADMNILLPGDVVVIPDIRPRGEQLATLRRHRFRRKGIPALFRLQLFDLEEPRANQGYLLDIDGVVHEGVTDDQGVFEVYLPPGAEEGKLVIGPDKLYLEIVFGHLDPISEVVGVQKRLNNLGYDCGAPDGELGPRTHQALRRFQERMDLPVTGEPDEATCSMLDEVHDTTAQLPDEPASNTA